jgi:hypothetical protein
MAGDPSVEQIKASLAETQSGAAPQTLDAHVGELTLAALERAVCAADPAVILVIPRIVRRVIRQQCELPGLGLKVPHRKSFVIRREPLLQICDRTELGLPDGAELPPQVILIARPDPDKLAAMTPSDVLLRCWRLVFHARVHWVLQERIADGSLTAADVRERIHQIGPTQFGEIRAVLAQEDLLLPPRDDVAAYVEFAAVYLELRFFARGLLPYYFPSIEDPEAIDAILTRDVDAKSLFRAARPQWAPEPQHRLAPLEVEDWPEEGEVEDAATPPPADRPSADKYRRLVRRADQAAAAGNVVRSAIYRARGERVVPPELAARARTALKSDVSRLVHRLLAALGIQETDPHPWQEILLALARQAPCAIWTAEARLLYDLQKVCVDHEREIYTVDVVEWTLSLGRRRMKRPLPSQRDVLICKHLRSAVGKLPQVRVSDSRRHQLSVLLRAAEVQAEFRVRERFRPLLSRTLDEVGLVPKNVPERVSRRKIIEELLDRVAERGFLVIGDLRDALSRNNLKLPDVPGLGGLWRGDALLRADRRLAETLDGVYGRAEFYLRWLQGLSSLGFGTKTGRFLTRFVVVPFGGAYLVLEGIKHLVHWFHRSPVPVKTPGWVTLWQVFQLGLLLLGIINYESFRRATGRLLKAWWHAAYHGTVRTFRAVTQWPPLQAVFRSRLFALTMRYLFKPLVIAWLAWWALPVEHVEWHRSAATGVVLFVAVNVLLNSRIGRDLEEVLTDGIVQAWRRIGVRILSNLFYLIMEFFKGILWAMERLLYTVDEWLRFRSGQSKLTLVGKAVLGVIWFYVTYIVRFGITVLIEPQINPIKHFPVVTVSHKILLPMIPTLAKMLDLMMDKLILRFDNPSLDITRGTAVAIVTSVIWAIPGMFGFLVWELKENWRLYEANRPTRLRPAVVGRHGETMMRLLRPGFHSGTLPKRYARIRRALRKALGKGVWKPVRKHLEVLRHLESSIHHHVDRELLALFRESRAWRSTPVTIEEIHVGGNRAKIALGCKSLAGEKLWLSIEMQSGWLLAGIVEPGWLVHLPPEQLEVLRTALIGLYRLSGVELVRQQIEAHLPVPPPVYEMTNGTLTIWPTGPSGPPVRYDLSGDSSFLVPQFDGPSGWLGQSEACPSSAKPSGFTSLPPSPPSVPSPLPVLERWRLVFKELPIPWDTWVRTWEEDQTGRGPGSDFLPLARVLPKI